MRLYLTIIYNVFKWFLMKIQYGSRYDGSLIERFHPSVNIRLNGKSRIQIARNLELSKDSDIQCFGNSECRIGEYTYANQRLMISCHAGVTIGNHCLFGPDVKIFDNNHTFSYVNGVSTDLKTAPIVIGDNCWIASNVVILKGSTIGEGCVIGAGCVISGDIPPHSIVKQSSNNIEIIPIRK